MAPARNRFRPGLESLETRALPSVSAVHAPAPTVVHVAVVSPVTPGQQVLHFALAHLGQQVGDGQCATLAVQALESAGAKTTFDYGVYGASANYVWGKLVLTDRVHAHVNWSVVKPGDVLQFSNFLSVTRTAHEISVWSTPHHTAIVLANNGNGRLTVLEQNVGSSGATEAQRMVVQKDVYDFRTMLQGTVWVYRPVAKSS